MFPVGMVNISDEASSERVCPATYILSALVKTDRRVNISLASQMLNYSHSWEGDNIVISR